MPSRVNRFSEEFWIAIAISAMYEYGGLLLDLRWVRVFLLSMLDSFCNSLSCGLWLLSSGSKLLPDLLRSSTSCCLAANCPLSVSIGMDDNPVCRRLFWGNPLMLSIMMISEDVTRFCLLSSAPVSLVLQLLSASSLASSQVKYKIPTAVYNNIQT